MRDTAPHSIEAEQAVIGAVLIGADAPDLRPEDFYRSDHQRIWHAIQSCAGAIDYVLVGDRLGDDLDAVGGIAYLGTLASNTPTAANIEHYAAIVRERAFLRRVKAAALDVADKADAGEIDDRAGGLVGAQAHEQWHQVDLTNTTAPDAPRHVISPILPRRNVTLLGGHGGMGKSLLALIMGAHVACGRMWCGMPITKGRVLFVSLEDPGELVRFRLQNIIRAYGLNEAAVLGSITVIDAADSDGALVTEAQEFGARKLQSTRAMTELHRLAHGCDLKSSLTTPRTPSTRMKTTAV